MPTRDAVRLTNLSAEQLREWTSRRALIQPDVRPRGRGSPARYSWQTILVLRVAVVLRNRFKVELESQKDLFADLVATLKQTSFISLWGKALLIHGDANWALVDAAENNILDDCIVLKLEPHLQVLSAGFSLPQPVAMGQLFPATEFAKVAPVRGMR